MDSNDLSIYHSISFLMRSERDSFVERNNLYDFDSLVYLLLVNYVINLRGCCYVRDVAILKGKGVIPTSGYQFLMARRRLWGMSKSGLIVSTGIRGESNSVLGIGYILTDRGRAVLDNYSSLYSRKERELIYGLKKIHKESCEVDKKDVI